MSYMTSDYKSFSLRYFQAKDKLVAYTRFSRTS